MELEDFAIFDEFCARGDGIMTLLSFWSVIIKTEADYTSLWWAVSALFEY